MGQREETRRFKRPLCKIRLVPLAAILLLVVVILAAAVVACAEETTTTTAASTETTAASTETTAASGDTTEIDVGFDPNALPADPDGVLAALDPAAMAVYAGYPRDDVPASPWADFAGKPGPWRIGLTGHSESDAFGSLVYHTIQDLFDEAKEKGLVTGELWWGIPSDASLATPANQMADFQAMIRDGVDGILMLPLSGDTIAPAITTAGEDNGVPTIVMCNVNSSPYAITVFCPNLRDVNFAAAQLVNEGKVLIVRGLAGVPNELVGYNDIQDALAKYTGLEVVGEVTGNYSTATTSQAVQEFLASHPGEIDLVMQCGVMGQGVIQGFLKAGREVPVVALAGATQADLAWFRDNVDNGYRTFANCYNGVQQGYASWQVLMRVLAGKGLTVHDIPFRPSFITAENVSDFTSPDADINTVADCLGTPEEFAPEEYLDYFFKIPGNVETLDDIEQ